MHFAASEVRAAVILRWRSLSKDLLKIAGLSLLGTVALYVTDVATRSNDKPSRSMSEPAVAPIMQSTPTLEPSHTTTSDPPSDAVSLNEVLRFGLKHFAGLDPDKDGTLDQRSSMAAAMDSANPDADGTLDKAEYESVITEAFKQADLNGNGLLGQQELKSRAGKKLLALLGIDKPEYSWAMSDIKNGRFHSDRRR